MVTSVNSEGALNVTPAAAPPLDPSCVAHLKEWTDSTKSLYALADSYGEKPTSKKRELILEGMYTNGKFANAVAAARCDDGMKLMEMVGISVVEKMTKKYE